VKMLAMFLNQPSSGSAQHSGLLDAEVKVEVENLDQKVIYDVDNWCQILLAVKGRSCPWLPWTFVMLTTTAFVLIDDKYGFSIFGNGIMNRSVNPMVHSTFGIVLGFLIVYQSTESSQRWWEGRVAWENMITHIREAMRILCSHCNGRGLIKLFGKYLIAFAITSKHYLRNEKFTNEERCPELDQILPPADLDRLYQVANRNRPLACLYAAQRISEVAIQQGLFTRPVARDINPRLIEMADQLGCCERILFTPMPWVYTLHLRLVLILFLMITPLGLFEEKPLPGVAQIYIFTAILAYAFLGLEDMAVKIQNPFGYNPSHLPLDIFTIVAYKDVKEIISMKYNSFDKSYTDKIIALGKYEIDWKRKNAIEEDEEEGDDGDD
jgi:putative membrane protein